MAEQSLQCDQNIEYHLVTMFEKLETMRIDTVKTVVNSKIPVQVEIRTLEFWRSVISECLSSFIYVFVVCGAAAGSGVGAPFSSSPVLATALASGFAMTSLTQCFGHISGNFLFLHIYKILLIFFIKATLQITHLNFQR